MTPYLPQLHRSSLNELKRGVYVPPLPLELWILIFFQNTDPSHLYTVGRQVCSAWRTEIPKVIAKKYLEDPVMVQIHSDCDISHFKNFTCLLEHELGFSHYEGNDRVVFKPIFRAEPGDHEDECTARYIRARNDKSQSVEDLRLPLRRNPANYLEKVGGKHVDLPPCQIRIKWVSNDTELPKLRVDFEKGEISFEWKAMLELFFREAAILGRHDCLLATEAMQWLKEEDRSMTAVLLRTWKDRAAREQHRMDLRQFRIQNWFRDVHNHAHNGTFDEHFEDMALRAFRNLEWPEPCIRLCAEDREEVRLEESQWEAYNMLRRMEIVTEDRKFPHGYGEYLDADWEMLSAKVWSVETPADEKRLERQMLFSSDLSNRHLWPNVIENQTDGERALVYDLEYPSAKAEKEKEKETRHEREMHYCESWLGRSRN
jgi:hypothetical protein